MISKNASDIQIDDQNIFSHSFNRSSSGMGDDMTYDKY